jgi:hypothetical protein
MLFSSDLERQLNGYGLTTAHILYRIPDFESLVYGEGRFAVMSANMAEAIRVNADELARDTPETTERILQQASAMISQFKAAYPHRILSRSVN